MCILWCKIRAGILPSPSMLAPDARRRSSYCHLRLEIPLIHPIFATPPGRIFRTPCLIPKKRDLTLLYVPRYALARTGYIQRPRNNRQPAEGQWIFVTMYRLCLSVCRTGLDGILRTLQEEVQYYVISSFVSQSQDATPTCLLVPQVNLGYY